MKKYFFSLSLIFMLLFSINAMAQRKGSVWISGEAGLNSNWILNQNAYGNQEMEYATTFGSTGGIGLSYFKNREWGMQGAAYYSKMGQNYSGYQAGAQAKRKVSLNYIEVPLKIMRQIPDMAFPTWISAGPDFMFLLNARQSYSRDGGSVLPNPDGMAEGNIKERFKPVDVALNISLNRMVELNYSRNIMFLFSINSSVGLLDMNSSDFHLPNTHNIYASSHNFYVGVKLGMMFKVGMLGGSHW